jgi:hypothetical protein
MQAGCWGATSSFCHAILKLEVDGTVMCPSCLFVLDTFHFADTTNPALVKLTRLRYEAEDSLPHSKFWRRVDTNYTGAW